MSPKSAHIIIMMSSEEDINATKLNHVIHVNVQSEPELYFFYFVFLVHALVVKWDIVAEECFVSAVWMAGCMVIHAAVYEDLS